MVTTTGYTDTFNRTVSNGFGTADSGQAYTINGTATQYSVAPSVASIAISASGNQVGIVNVGSGLFFDISGQVAISAIPATNLATAGFIARGTDANNWFAGSLMVATGGAMSIRLSKCVAGGLITLNTVALGITYVAGTYYNLRFQAYWSRLNQASSLLAKVWAVGSTQPGGWQATFTTDSSFTDYTGGQFAGLYGRDESTTLGTITTKWQNVASSSYHLPMPATTDPMCADPSVSYPKQTALQTLATAADAAMAAIDPSAASAALYPRVRVSAANQSANSALTFVYPTFTTTEFNVGTPTNLGYNSAGISLGVGIWLVNFEIRLSEAASSGLSVTLGGGPTAGTVQVNMRSNAVQSNDAGVGGTTHFSTMTWVTNPATPSFYSVYLSFTSFTTVYNIAYMALTAVKISDYFL